MRLLVCGGRGYNDRALLFTTLDEIDRAECIDCIIEGEASGADKLARQWAEARGVPYHPFPADWDNLNAPGAVVRRSKGGRSYNANAGPARNRQMLFEGRPDLVLGFPGGDGTRNMLTQAVNVGVDIRII